MRLGRTEAEADQIPSQKDISQSTHSERDNTFKRTKDAHLWIFFKEGITCDKEPKRTEYPYTRILIKQTHNMRQDAESNRVLPYNYIL